MGRTKTEPEEKFVDVIRVQGQKVTRPEFNSFLKENTDLFLDILDYKKVSIPFEEFKKIKGLKIVEEKTVSFDTEGDK